MIKKKPSKHSRIPQKRHADELQLRASPRAHAAQARRPARPRSLAPGRPRGSVPPAALPRRGQVRRVPRVRGRRPGVRGSGAAGHGPRARRQSALSLGQGVAPAQEDQGAALALRIQGTDHVMYPIATRRVYI